MRLPHRPDPRGGDDDWTISPPYWPTYAEPPASCEVWTDDPPEGLLGPDGEPLSHRIPVGFQPPVPSTEENPNQ